MTAIEEQKNCKEFSKAILETYNKMESMWKTTADYDTLVTLIDELEIKGNELKIDEIFQDSRYIKFRIERLKEDLQKSCNYKWMNDIDIEFALTFRRFALNCKERGIDLFN